MSQTKRMFDLLKDKKPHRTDEILRKVYKIDQKGIARISARIYDLKQKYGMRIESWQDEKRHGLFWYQAIYIPENTVFKK